MTKLAYLASGAVALVLATSAIAADLPYRRQAPIDGYAAPPVFTNFTWTGAYVGGNLGWRAATFSPVINSLEIAGKTRHSLYAGGHVGYNFQVAPNVVVGAEADMGYGGGEAKGPAVGAGLGILSSRASLGWTGSVRGRLGYTQDNWMIYGTGGLAFADLEVQAALSTPGSVWTATNNKWAAGYTVGAGLEYMITPNITVRGEYLYADYGRNTVAVPTGGQASVEVDSHTARAGVSYKF
jgi:outer membrane immunogenic protein